MPRIHIEEGTLVLVGREAALTASFVEPFDATPGRPGGYAYSFSLVRTDGIKSVPAVVVTETATGYLKFEIFDPFIGSISWRASIGDDHWRKANALRRAIALLVLPKMPKIPKEWIN